MAADTSTAEILLQNIKLNLSDSTNFGAVNTAIKSVDIMPEFFVVARTTPAVVVVPGDADIERDGLSTGFEREVAIPANARRGELTAQLYKMTRAEWYVTTGSGG